MMTKPENLPKLLCIDDSEADGELLRILLRRQGIEVELALSGGKGLDIYRPGYHDAVVIDWNLPDIDGKTLAMSFLGGDPECRIALISGFIEARQREAAAALRIHCFEKSVDMEHVGHIADFVAAAKTKQKKRMA